MTLVINGLNIELSPVRHEGVNRITKADLLSVGNIVCKVVAILTRPPCLNSSTPSDDAYMRQRTRPSLFHIMICHLIDAKIIMWASAGFCQLDSEKYIVVTRKRIIMYYYHSYHFLPYSVELCRANLFTSSAYLVSFIWCPWHPTCMHLLWMTCWYSGTCL